MTVLSFLSSLKISCCDLLLRMDSDLTYESVPSIGGMHSDLLPFQEEGLYLHIEHLQ